MNATVELSVTTSVRRPTSPPKNRRNRSPILGRVFGPTAMMSFRDSHRYLAAVLAVLLPLAQGVVNASEGDSDSVEVVSAAAGGQALFADHCVDCHGDLGEGVSGAYESPLVGDLSIVQLASVIDETMPEGDADAIDAAQSLEIAEYIYEKFYSPAAQMRLRPPRRSVSRLTADQLRNSLADLYAVFAGNNNSEKGTGLTAKYYNEQRRKDEQKKIDRIDPYIDFDWGQDGPGAGIKGKNFFVHWEGALVPPIDGRYEIVIRSSVAFTLKFLHPENLFIDNHVQSADRTEFRRSVYLSGGRRYPIQLSLNNRERKTDQPPATVQLAWVMPGCTEQTIAPEYLYPHRTPPAFSLQSPLPADDRTYGYDRGIAVNRQWDDAVTMAIVEFSKAAEEQLWPEYQKKHRKKDLPEAELLKNFLTEMATAAFRRQIDPTWIDRYVLAIIGGEADHSIAIRKTLLFTLKSPWFLYPEVNPNLTPAGKQGLRLSLLLHDSLPTDDRVIKVMERKEAMQDGELRDLANWMLSDPKAAAKAREIFYDLLKLDLSAEITKDAERFPQWDAELVSDLRRSMERQVADFLSAEKSDWRGLLQSSRLFMTPRIASVYGYCDPESIDKLAAEQQAAWKAGGDYVGLRDLPPEHILVSAEATAGGYHGILTHPLVLAEHAYHDETSPIHRGVFLLRNVLGRALKPPAEAISPLPADLHPDLTTRQRVELQTSGEACAGCHVRINGLGFVLESYDAIGRWRESDKDKPIDASGRYAAVDGSDVTLEGPQRLVDYLATSDDATAAIVERVFEHYVKQPLAAYGSETAQQLQQRFVENDYDLKQLIIDVCCIETDAPAYLTSMEKNDDAAQ